MKALKKKWLRFYGKLLTTGISVLGFASCGLIRVVQPPCVYGPPPPRDKVQTDSLSKSPIQEPEVKPMYGVRPAPFEKLPE